MVCIGTHASVDRMHWIVQMANRWSGPISVALFAPDVEFTIAVVFIEYLRNCFPNVRDRVSFHLIYPGIVGVCWERESKIHLSNLFHFRTLSTSELVWGGGCSGEHSLWVCPHCDCQPADHQACRDDWLERNTEVENINFVGHPPCIKISESRANRILARYNKNLCNIYWKNLILLKLGPLSFFVLL